MDFLRDFEIAIEHSKKTDELVKGRIDIILTYILTYVKKLELVDLSDISMQVKSRHWFISSLRYTQSTQRSKRSRIWQQLGECFLVYIDDITIKQLLQTGARICLQEETCKSDSFFSNLGYSRQAHDELEGKRLYEPSTRLAQHAR